MHGHGATPPSAATPGKRTNRAPAPSAASPSTVLKAPPPFGRDDQPHSGVVPAEHMLQLFDAATSATDKVFHRVPDGMHNDTWLKGGEEYWTERQSP